MLIFITDCVELRDVSFCTIFRSGAHRDRRRVDVCVYVCNALFGGAQTGCDDRQPPTSFYNRTGPPHRARSS